MVPVVPALTQCSEGDKRIFGRVDRRVIRVVTEQVSGRVDAPVVRERKIVLMHMSFDISLRGDFMVRISSTDSDT